MKTKYDWSGEAVKVVSQAKIKEVYPNGFVVLNNNIVVRIPKKFVDRARAAIITKETPLWLAEVISKTNKRSKP